MKAILALFVLIFIASTVAFSQKTGPRRKDRSVAAVLPVKSRIEEEKLREMRKRWDEAFALKDSDAQADMFAVDGILIAGGKQPLEGREAFRRSALRVLKRPNILLTHEPTKVEVSASGDMAFELGSWKESWDEPDGRTTLEGRYFAVWKKFGGSWKIAAQTLRVYACSGSSYCNK